MFYYSCIMTSYTVQVFLCISILFDICSSSLAPNVWFTFPDIADCDFENGTLGIFSNANPAFELHCNATYPVEWIIHYTPEDDGTSEQKKNVEVFRIVENFTNPNSYIYNTTLRLEYKGKLFMLPNFTCKHTSSGNSSLQRHVIMQERNEKKVLTLQISDNYDLEKSSISNWQKDENQKCSVFAVVSKQKNRTCWNCEAATEGVTTSEPQLDFITCHSASECNSMHSKLKRGKACLKESKNFTTCGYPHPPDYYPTIVLCKHYGPVLAQFYFYELARRNQNEDVRLPEIYFDWSEANPKFMLKLLPFEKRSLYLSEPTQFTCEYSRFYFAMGSWLAIESSSGIEYIKGNDIRSWYTKNNGLGNCPENEDTKNGTFKAIFNTKLNETGPHKVYCLGPVWNSTEWVNVTRSISVKEGETPKITSVAPISSELYVGDTFCKVRCNFQGKPTPSVTWTKPNDATAKIKTGENYSELTISGVGTQTAGIYTCTVSSYLGQQSKSYNLTPEFRTRLSKSVIIVMVVISTLGVIIVGGVFWRMRVVIKQQRKHLRLLTDKEVEEFIEGNPEVIRNMVGDDGFRTSLAMEALPFEEKFEIPVEKLDIDFSKPLGSGEFGLVYCGLLRSHLKSNEDPNLVKDDGLKVAVKTCRRDVEVANFKALLTEVKVMAYLGNHENLVSLIGATIANIRNREIYIAVEFCECGSLKNYLSNNKKRFVDKLPIGAGQGYVRLSLDKMFSSVDLFKWCSQISQAVEYMHEKKVIHGDLAARNVLLTLALQAKVGDFGLSRQLVETSSYTKRTKCALPWRNMALESLKELLFTPKSDMWSMGVTFWEIFSLGDTPYPGMTYSAEFLRELESGKRLGKPNSCSEDMYNFMVMCWSFISEDRPCPSDATKICEQFLKDDLSK